MGRRTPLSAPPARQLPLGAVQLLLLKKKKKKK